MFTRVIPKAIVGLNFMGPANSNTVTKVEQQTLRIKIRQIPAIVF